MTLSGIFMTIYMHHHHLTMYTCDICIAVSPGHNNISTHQTIYSFDNDPFFGLLCHYTSYVSGFLNSVMSLRLLTQQGVSLRLLISVTRHGSAFRVSVVSGHVGTSMSCECCRDPDIAS